jgi:hypothetical protein
MLEIRDLVIWFNPPRHSKSRISEIKFSSTCVQCKCASTNYFDLLSFCQELFFTKVSSVIIYLSKHSLLFEGTNKMMNVVLAGLLIISFTSGFPARRLHTNFSQRLNVATTPSKSIYIYIYMCTCIYIYLYTYIHTYMYTHM